MLRAAIAGAAFLALLMVGAASADVLYPAALTFENGYASGPPLWFPWATPPDYGDPFTLVGRVAVVGAPFADLPPAGVHELTFVYEGATCVEWGMWDNIPCSGGMYGAFRPGTLAIYLDATPDADFTSPPTYRDGELLLLAETSIVLVNDDDPYEACPMVPDQPDVVAYLAFVGGSWFSRVTSRGVGLSGRSNGELTGHNPGNVSSELRALGYVLRVDGTTVDVYAPVPVAPTHVGPREGVVPVGSADNQFWESFFKTPFATLLQPRSRPACRACYTESRTVLRRA